MHRVLTGPSTSMLSGFLGLTFSLRTVSRQQVIQKTLRILGFSSSSWSQSAKSFQTCSPGIAHSSSCLHREVVEVTSADGRCLSFPWVWLRDNCQCEKCFNPQLQSRTIDWRHVDVEVTPTKVTNNGGELDVHWSDGHHSRFTAQWLGERSFHEDDRKEWLREQYILPQEPWGAADFPRILVKLRFEDVMNSNESLLQWLEALSVYGVAIVEKTPLEDHRLRQLAERVAFIKKTHYGEEFEVKNKPDTTNVAYLSTPLQMHADLPYYEYKPGVNLLHCMEQAAHGAVNLLADGLLVAAAFRAANPSLYAVYSSVSVEWSDVGQESGVSFHSLHRCPAICLDDDGNVVRINYSQQQRASFFSARTEDVVEWYKAHHAFTQLLYHPDNLVQLKTRPGDVLAFNNLRLLHGRAEYNDIAGAERRLIGAYLDWDVVRSRVRVLRRQLRRGASSRGAV